MFKEIKYTYIPKQRSTDAILTTLTYAIKSFDGLIDEYKIIDNLASGIRVYPAIIQDAIERIHKDELIKRIEDLVEDGIDLILINGFDIDLDEIKEVYAPLVDATDIMICINELHDVEDSIAVKIDPKIYEVTGDKWEQLKEEINESMFEAMESDDISFLRKIVGDYSLNSDKKENSKIKFISDENEFLESLKNIFDISGDIGSKLDDVAPEESYTQTLNDKELTITKTINGDIVIDNEFDMITIEKDQLDFFVNIINQIMK